MGLGYSVLRRNVGIPIHVSFTFRTKKDFGRIPSAAARAIDRRFIHKFKVGWSSADANSFPLPKSIALFSFPPAHVHLHDCPSVVPIGGFCFSKRGCAFLF